jgi:hypothetical protein
VAAPTPPDDGTAPAAPNTLKEALGAWWYAFEEPFPGTGLYRAGPGSLDDVLRYCVLAVVGAARLGRAFPARAVLTLAMAAQEMSADELARITEGPKRLGRPQDEERTLHRARHYAVRARHYGARGAERAAMEVGDLYGASPKTVKQSERNDAARAALEESLSAALRRERITHAGASTLLLERRLLATIDRRLLERAGKRGWIDPENGAYLSGRGAPPPVHNREKR